MTQTTSDSFAGCLLGGAIGDSLGLPAEGLSRARQRRLFGEIEGQRLFFGRGMVSDDTEHAIMVARALLASGGDPGRFQKSLASQLRRWLLCLPAGVGLATLRATLKLLIGVPPGRSGVASAGNGPAMRAALIGVYCQKRPEDIPALVRASTEITHTDRRAEFGALAVALAARSFTKGQLDPLAYRAVLDQLFSGPYAAEIQKKICLALESAERGESTRDFAASIGLGDRVSGYIEHTVPVCLHAAFRRPNDFRAAIRDVIACGGDTDTTAAIVGGIVGARVGKAGIPPEWLTGLAEWPCSVAWMERLAGQLQSASESKLSVTPIGAPLPFVFLRNLFFLIVVLYHGFRRLLPPPIFPSI